MAMTDAQWAALAPLVEASRPRSKRPPRDLRRTLDGILWRHRNGATWRAVPAEYGPWWRAAQLFIRWSRLGAWQRLLGLAQEREVELGLVLLDGSVIRAHHKAAGARKRGPAAQSANAARRSAGRAAASARKPASPPTAVAGRSP